MAKKIINLKAWAVVKTKAHSIENLRESDPSMYLYQLTGGIYYPALRLSDVPDDWNLDYCYRESD
jgi:hypothetical protein